jgi:hypothetical protein
MACVLTTLIELVQGPNKANQDLIASTSIARNLGCVVGTEFTRAGEIYFHAERPVSMDKVDSILGAKVCAFRESGVNNKNSSTAIGSSAEDRVETLSGGHTPTEIRLLAVVLAAALLEGQTNGLVLDTVLWHLSPHQFQDALVHNYQIHRWIQGQLLQLQGLDSELAKAAELREAVQAEGYEELCHQLMMLSETLASFSSEFSASMEPVTELNNWLGEESFFRAWAVLQTKLKEARAFDNPGTETDASAPKHKSMRTLSMRSFTPKTLRSRSWPQDEKVVLWSAAWQSAAQFLRQTGGGTVLSASNRSLLLLTEKVVNDERDLQDFLEACEKTFRSCMFRYAYSYFDERILSVEIYRDGEISRSYFPRPAIASGLEREAKVKLTAAIDLSSPEDKLKDFVKRARALHSEMVHFSALQQYSTLPGINTSMYDLVGKKLDLSQNICFALAVSINAITLFSIRLPSHSGQNTGNTTHLAHGGVAPSRAYSASLIGGSGEELQAEWSRLTALVLAILLSSLSLVQLSFQLIKRAPLEYRKQVLEFRRRMHNQHWNLLDGLEYEFESLFEGLKGIVIDVAPPIIMKQSALIFVAGLMYASMDTNWGFYLALMVLAPMVLKALRAHWDCPESPVALMYVCTFDIWMNPSTLFRIAHFVLACLGVFVAPFFFCFHLFEIILLSSTLRNVVCAVWKPLGQLGLTVLLMMFVIFTYTIIGVFAFEDEFGTTTNNVKVLLPFTEQYDDGYGGVETNYCSTVAGCYVWALYRGLVFGGIGSALESLMDPGVPTSLAGTRLIFDLGFYVMVSIALMNMIFIIMVDTFRQLRGAEENRFDKLHNSCFMCHKHRSTFGSEWTAHIKHEHNISDYILYIAHLYQKDHTEHTVSHSFVAMTHSPETHTNGTTVLSGLPPRRGWRVTSSSWSRRR